MQLTFRGHFYKTPTPIQLASSSAQPDVELTYRGNPYYSTPRLKDRLLQHQISQKANQWKEYRDSEFIPTE